MTSTIENWQKANRAIRVAGDDLLAENLALRERIDELERVVTAARMMRDELYGSLEAEGDLEPDWSKETRATIFVFDYRSTMVKT